MFCKRLRSLRESKGLNMKQFAFELGIPYTTYYNYETGSREVNSDILVLLSEYFNVSVDYLLGVTDIKERTDRLIESYPTPHEQKVITAYRAQPDMQAPVDKLLGISDDLVSGGRYGNKMPVAAHGGGVTLVDAPDPSKKQKIERLAKEALDRMYDEDEEF